MESLKNEILRLIDKLKQGGSGDNEIEADVLSHLQKLESGSDGWSGNIESMDAVFGQLRQLWMSSVPWCSELSKDIEKLIMMAEDLQDAASNFPDSP